MELDFFMARLPNELAKHLPMFVSHAWEILGPGNKKGTQLLNSLKSKASLDQGSAEKLVSFFETELVSEKTLFSDILEIEKQGTQQLWKRPDLGTATLPRAIIEYAHGKDPIYYNDIDTFTEHLTLFFLNKVEGWEDTFCKNTSINTTSHDGGIDGYGRCKVFVNMPSRNTGSQIPVSTDALFLLQSKKKTITAENIRSLFGSINQCNSRTFREKHTPLIADFEPKANLSLLVLSSFSNTTSRHEDFPFFILELGLEWLVQCARVHASDYETVREKGRSSTFEDFCDWFERRVHKFIVKACSR